METEQDSKLLQLENYSIIKLIIIYGVPAIITLIAISSYELADRIIVGQFANADELGYLGVGLPVVFFFEAMCAMIKVGSSCALSRKLGEDDIPKGQMILGSSYSLAFVIGMVILLVGTLFSDKIAVLCGATDEMIKGASDYIFYLSLGAPFYFALFVSNGALRAQAKPFLASTIIIISTVLNIVLCLLFVAVFHLGAKGSALATMSSQIIGGVIGILFIGNSKNILHFHLKSLNLKLKNTKEILSVGFSSALFEFSFVIYGLVLNNILNSFNDPLLIAVNVTLASIILLINAPMTGIAEAAQTIAAYNFGKQNMNRVRKSILYAWLVGMGVLLVIDLFVQMYPQLVINIFVLNDPEFIEMASGALRIAVFMAPFMSSMLLIPDILGALGDAKRSIILNFISLFVLQIPLVILLPKLFGVNGVWLSFPVFDVASTLLCLLICINAFKKLNEKVGDTV